MKKLLFICLVGCMSILQSCKDECKDVSCVNGDCVEGSCDCDDGYTGETCEIVARDGLIGTWIGNTICPDEPASAETYTISEGLIISEISISGGAANQNYTAKVTGLNAFTIEEFTEMSGEFEITKSGTGTINSNGQLIMSISEEVASFGSKTCEFTGAK